MSIHERGSEDPLYRDAVRLVTERGAPSVAYVQRKLNIGYNRAMDMMDAMADEGLIPQPGPGGQLTRTTDKDSE